MLARAVWITTLALRIQMSIVGSLVGIVAEPGSSALLLRSCDSRTSSRWCSRCWRWLYPVVAVLYSLPRSHIYRASFARPLVRRFHRGFPFASRYCRSFCIFLYPDSRSVPVLSALCRIARDFFRRSLPPVSTVPRPWGPFRQVDDAVLLAVVCVRVAQLVVGCASAPKSIMSSPWRCRRLSS